MRTVISEDNSRFLVSFDDTEGGDDESAFNDIVMEQLLRATDAATAALTIMTAQKMPKQVFCFIHNLCF